MVGQLRRTRPHCRQHRPTSPRSQHRPIGMEHGRQHLAAPRRHRPPTAPQTTHRHRAAGKNHLQQSGAKRIFHQQSHRLGIARLQQNQSRMGTRLYRPPPAQNGQTEPARSGEIFAAEGYLNTQKAACTSISKCRLLLCSNTVEARVFRRSYRGGRPIT